MGERGRLVRKPFGDRFSGPAVRHLTVTPYTTEQILHLLETSTSPKRISNRNVTVGFAGARSYA